MHDPLAPLLADGVIDEILTRLKSGKEADLWLVRHGQEVVAAKVYKERLTRSFKNDAAYREGRQVRNSRTQRAMDKGSRFGQQASEEAWKAKEADALHALHAAGVRVPRPVVFYEGVLLMELVLDPFGHPAPRLIDAHVTHEHAAPLYEDLRAQVVKMLCCDLIHGDLSPYNILAGREGPVVIDFPQVIGAAHNSQAERFFLRDLDNLRRFFEPLDHALKGRAGDGREIWRAYLRRELTPDFVPTGRHVERAPQGRPQGDRPRHDRPQGERSQTGRPDHGRPPGERPRGDRPRHDRPQGERGQTGRPQGDRPRGDQPRVDRPREDRPRDDRPRDDRPHGDRPHGDRPHHDRPREDRPRSDRPRNDRPQGDRPLHGQRPDHRDRGDRREQSVPPKAPQGPGRGPSQPEVVRVARLPAPPRPQGHGHGIGQGQGGSGGQPPRQGGGPRQGGEPHQGGHPRHGDRRGRRR